MCWRALLVSRDHSALSLSHSTATTSLPVAARMRSESDGSLPSAYVRACVRARVRTE
jgi:hypothetical protein